jgi:proliferating cell nuclear antigen
MNITINDSDKANVFCYIFQHIKQFTENINIMFEENRMYIQSMDNSRISMFELFLKKEWFDSYKLEKKITIGINSVTLFRILNTREKSQNIYITYDENKQDKLHIKFNSLAKELENLSISKTKQKKEEILFEKEFEISLIDLDVETFEIPVIEYEAEISLNSTHFYTLIGQLKVFGDNLEIYCSENLVKLTSKSIELGKMSVNIKIEDIDEFSIIEDTILNLSFTLNTLNFICNYHKLSDNVLIMISKNYPLKITYNLKNNSSFEFHLAPRISDDTDDM